VPPKAENLQRGFRLDRVSIKYEGAYGYPVSSRMVDMFPLLERSIGDSLGGVHQRWTDSIPNIGFPRSLMMTQLYVARETDAPAQCWCWCSKTAAFCICGVLRVRMRREDGDSAWKAEKKGTGWAGACICAGVG